MATSGLHFLFLFTMTLAAIVLATPLSKKWGFLDKPSGRKAHGASVPYSGGPALGFALLPWLWFFGPNIVAWPAFAGIALLWLIGLVDDARPLPSLLKFVAQSAAVGAIVVAQQPQVMAIGEALLPLGTADWLILSLAIFCGIGLVNATNMVDGSDGLAASQVLCVAFGVFWLAGSGSGAATVAVAVGGAVTAYLIFNLKTPWRPERIFMGDSGALMLGGLLVAMVITATAGVAEHGVKANAPWVLVYLLSDTVAVMVARLSVGRSPFSPDRWHLHHQLLDAGIGPNGVVAISVALALAGLVIGGSLASAGLAASEVFLCLLCTVGAYAVLMALRLRRKADVVSSS